MRNFIDHEFPEIKRVYDNNQRLYLTPDGEKYPSVTTVTGFLSKRYIDAWRKKVGEEVANRISSKAAKRGTRVHTLCEKYLLGEEIKCEMPDLEVWKQFEKELNHIDNIHALETPLMSKKLKVCGTVDCIAEYKGKLSIIDFKSSKRVKQAKDIEGYLMQCSAYSACFFEMTRIPVNNLVIIMGVDDQTKPSIFEESALPWIKRFMIVREQYQQEFGI